MDAEEKHEGKALVDNDDELSGTDQDDDGEPTTPLITPRISSRGRRGSNNVHFQPDADAAEAKDEPRRKEEKEEKQVEKKKSSLVSEKGYGTYNGERSERVQRHGYGT